MDPIRLLKRQHRNVETLFKKVAEAEEAAERRDLLGQIASSLALHMKLEESIFYPAVRELQTKKAEHMVLEAYEEHHVVKLVLAEVPELDPQDERFEAKVTVLRELIEHHVDEEEKVMFKLAGKLDIEDLEALGDRMAREAEKSGAVPKDRKAA
jgi:hemerythrin superfamily protein